MTYVVDCWDMMHLENKTLTMRVERSLGTYVLQGCVQMSLYKMSKREIIVLFT